MAETHRPFVEKLVHLRQRAQRGPLTLQQFVDELGEQQHSFLILHLSFPFFLPVPLPGLSAIFGLLIMAVTLSWIFGFKAWIPSRFKNYEMPKVVTEKVPEYGIWFFKKFEFLIHPRFEALLFSFVGRVVLGLALIFSAFVLALPLPPGTNFPPALIIALISFSMITGDGVIALLGLFILVAKIVLIHEFFHIVFDWIKPHISTLVAFLSGLSSQLQF